MAQLNRPTNPKEQMPEVAAWIEELRQGFGAELIDNALRNGLKNGGFWAIEKGFVVGTPPPDAIRKAQQELDAQDRLSLPPPG